MYYTFPMDQNNESTIDTLDASPTKYPPSSRFLICGIVIIILIVVGIGGYCIGKISNQNTNVPTDKNVAITTPSQPVSTIKQEKSFNNKFVSFQYPSDWIIHNPKSVNLDSIIISSFDMNDENIHDGIFMSLFVRNSQLTQEKTIQELRQKLIYEQDSRKDHKVIYADTKIDGLDAIVVEDRQDTDVPFYSKLVIAQKDGNFYSINFIVRGNTVDNRNLLLIKHQVTMDNILNSLRFK